MKNLLNISALLCAVALATSCSNEEIAENGAATDGLTLTATTGANTKTAVDGNYNVNWTTGDAFYVFGNKTGDKTYSSKGTFTLKSGSTTAGVFKGTVTGSMSKLQYAVYPAGKYDHSTMELTFPTTYTYPVSNAPMFGHVDGTHKKVAFDQLLCGMMRIKVKGLTDGTSGTLTLAGTGIAGSAKLAIDANTGVASLSDWSNQTNSITVTFTKPAGTDPLLLDIPLPEATYADGITATLAIGGESTTITTTKDFEVKAKTITEMAEATVSEIDGTTISFTQKANDAAGAQKLLETGAKNVTVAAMGSGDALEIPSTSSADEPVTINVTAATTEDFTVKGASGGTTEAIKINLPEGSKGTVTVENIKSVEISGGWDQASSGTVENPLVIAATAGTGVEELTVKDIEHVEVSGTWKKATASTGDNTFVVKADAVIKDLTVTKGNIEIKNGGVVNKLTLDADVTINKVFDIPTREKMEIILGTHQLTLGAGNYTRIFEDSELTITGDAGNRGKVVISNSKGISLHQNGANFTMTNVDYSATPANATGILLNNNVSNTVTKVENCSLTSGYYCINTNASATVGSNNAVTLKNSTFTAVETALMVNNNATATATGCTFTGGWQGAFLRGGTFTFDKCGFNLSVTSYGSSSVAAGAVAWKDGNQAPSAAITAGNRSAGAYDYKTNLTLKGSCTFSVANSKDSQTYPSIYIDAEKDKENQGVTFNYDNASKTSFDAAGTGLKIQEETGKVTVNNEPYIVD